MTQRQQYTSSQILNDKSDSVLYEIQESVCSSCKGITYVMTDGELQWLDFIKGKYSIADYIQRNLSDSILTISDNYELSIELDNDNKGAGKAAMLSDDTALQAIIFFCYTEQEFCDEA